MLKTPYIASKASIISNSTTISYTDKERPAYAGRSACQKTAALQTLAMPSTLSTTPVI